MERKYFLDWLRAGAFGLLAVFHVGLMYASWGYVFKSPRIEPAVEWVLVLFSPWRIVLLFFISGVACRFLMQKFTPGRFTRDRLLRLLPVILLGMYVINPTQNYIELLVAGALDPGYLEFWFGSYLTSADFPGRQFPTWDHLWFLVYLLAYILVLALAFAAVPDAFARSRASRLPVAALIAVPALWLAISNHLVDNVRPSTFAFANDWAVHIRSAGLFGFGVVAALHDEFWAWCRKHRTQLLIVSAALLGLVLTERAMAQAAVTGLGGNVFAGSLVRGFYGWSVILALAGYAARYLDRPSGVLSYLTAAVLPVYALHQPLMIFAAWRLFPLGLPVVLEGTLLVLITCLAPLAIYELLIRRIDPLRLAFGLKRKSRNRGSR